MYIQDIPENINNTYQVECELGSGGGGVVYKAWHSRLNKYVVIKADKQSLAADPLSSRNEADALKNVKCMYIPQVFDYLEKDDRSYTVIEFVEGVSFDKLLRERRVFENAKLTKWYLQLASALKSIHERDICHRDVKPSNIMLTTGGDAYLIDFNSALVGGSTAKLISRSPGYASPEQNELFAWLEHVRPEPGAGNHAGVDAGELISRSFEPGDIPGGCSSPGGDALTGCVLTELLEADCITEITDDNAGGPGPIHIPNEIPSLRQMAPPLADAQALPVMRRRIDWKLSDIYSLGATMYHLFTGKRPPGPAGDVAQHIKNNYQNGSIEFIIIQSMQREPESRFASADDLIRALHRV